MTVTREQEIWALALHAERTHGVGAERYIADRVRYFRDAGEKGGEELWKQVALRYAELKRSTSDEPN